MKHFYQSIEGWSNEDDQLQLLNTILSELQGDIVIAEIGVYCGRCTAMWNVELINQNRIYQYYGIDHFLGSEEHEKKDYFSVAKSNLEPIIDKIRLICENSESASTLFNNCYFDILYIDASHDYKSVKNDIENWLPKVKTGGYICGDDYSVKWPGVIAAVNEKFGNVKIIGKRQWVKKIQ